MRKTSFPIGGFFPASHKQNTQNERIRNAIIPAVSVVPFAQSSGDPAEPTVGIGSRVGEGMRIGRARKRGSCDLHSPVPGIVDAIRPIELPGGVQCDAAVIAMDGEFSRLGKPAEQYGWSSFAPSTLRRLIREGGVVELADGGHPVDAVLAKTVADRCSTLVVSGAESEPYLSVTQRMMVEHPAQLAEATAIVEKLLSPAKTVVAVERDKRDGLLALQDAFRKRQMRVQLFSLDLKYPQSDRLQLIRATTGREVPSGSEPIDIGCVVITVPTLFAIWEAVVLRKPLIERIVTVAGGAVEAPANLKVRIGTPVGSLLRECGLLQEEVARVVVGGPFRGFAVTDLTTPITKTTPAVLALTRKEVKSGTVRPCIECGRCMEVCPIGLNPTRLTRLVDAGEPGRAVAEGLLDCTECGLCSYICPSRIPLVDKLKEARGAPRTGIRTRQ